jgi:hypothetical protein
MQLYSIKSGTNTALNFSTILVICKFFLTLKRYITLTENVTVKLPVSLNFYSIFFYDFFF